MEISFVIYTHSFRLNNLKQTLRFLERREPQLAGSEIVLVFQDGCKNPPDSARFAIRTHSMKMDTYVKPKMCNVGVSLASHPIVAILDSDRILPHGYFLRNAKQLQAKEIVTTKSLRQCLAPATDEQIAEGKYEYVVEDRTLTNEVSHKNLFSGNTLLFKDDYLAMGGMDENFVGYGSADTDMTHTAMDYGCAAKYLDDIEIHLYHPRELIFQGNILADPYHGVIGLTNLLRYVKKRNIFCPEAQAQADAVFNQINTYPEYLRTFFLDVYLNRVKSVKYI